VKILEKYLTIQGEGIYLGVPSLFLRTTGCNLRCSFLNPDGKTRTPCDTYYTSWRPEDAKYDLTTEQIKEELAQKYPNVSDIVITGGEPFIQPGISDFINSLSSMGFFVTVETNGTIYKQTNADLISMSPKLSSSIPETGPEKEMHEKGRWSPHTFKKFYDNNLCQFKFVYSRKEDVDEIKKFLEEIEFKEDNDLGSQVVLMPQGVSVEMLKQNSIEAIEICKKTGWRFSPRSHIDIFGYKRLV
jgi:7-carboxy-7-deazaguanine synthase